MPLIRQREGAQKLGDSADACRLLRVKRREVVVLSTHPSHPSAEARDATYHVVGMLRDDELAGTR